MTPGTIPDAVRARVRAQAGNRCGYCLARQEYVPWLLEIEHIVPISKGGVDDEENLWLACRSCNLFKSDQTLARDPLTGRRVRLFNPRKQRWKETALSLERRWPLYRWTYCLRASHHRCP